jgi:DNA polymerase III epsilon subunit-like protein
MKFLSDHNIMIDLETLGTKSDAVIVSIGAVWFDKYEILDGTFYYAVDIQSCLDLGMSIDASTLEWWLKQGVEAKSVFSESKKHSIHNALNALNNFISYDFYYKSCEVWANGAGFDLPILESASRLAKVPLIYDFRQHRCYRTIVNLVPKEIKDSVKRGKIHNALEDAIYQAKVLIAANNEMK